MQEKFLIFLVLFIILSPLIVSSYIAYDNYKISKERLLLNEKFKQQINEFEIIIKSMRGK